MQAQGARLGRPGLYGAWTRGYRLDVFDRQSGAASVRLEHELARTSLTITLPGTPLERAAAGATATARTDTRSALGTLAVEWTSHDDRLEERLLLAVRPPGDALTLPLQAGRLAFAAAPDRAAAGDVDERLVQPRPAGQGHHPDL